MTRFKNIPLIQLLRWPFLTALYLVCLLSCTKKGDTGATGAMGPAGPAGPAGVASVGAITGHVTLYDQYGSKLFTGLSNVQVSLKGGQPISADSSGYYLFAGVSTGMYTLSAFAGNFGTTQINNISFVNDTLYQDVKMSAIPSFNFTGFKCYHNTGSVYDSLVLTLQPDTRPRSCIVFVNNTSIVNSDPAGYLLYYIKAIAANQGTLVVRIPNTDLNYANIYYGDEVYYAAYSYVVNDASVYEDESTGKNVFTAVGAALVDSCIAP